ncbi:Transposon TX1 uncharacterized 149 kDa protein [Linum grandiflorum]
MAWINSLVGTFLMSNPFCIVVEFRLPNDNIFIVVGVYLACDLNDRIDQLEFISQFSTQIKSPFVISGEFNSILAHSEKVSCYNPSSDNVNRSIDAFQQFVHRLALTDLFPCGPLFSWTNHQAHEVKSRLDRFLLSPNWLNLFLQSATHHLSDNGSDHKVVLLSYSFLLYGPKKYFLFDPRWLTNLEAYSIVSESWRNHDTKGSKLFKLHSKLKYLRHRLVDRQKGCSSNSARYHIQALKATLAFAKMGSDIQWDHIQSLEQELENELRLEDAFWKRKVRNQWLLQGDRNTKYYHRIANFNKNKMHIDKLIDSNGSSWFSEDYKQRIAIGYFQELFTSDHPPGFFPFHLYPSYSKSVSTADNALLIRTVYVREIKEVVFSLGPNQAPGSDGFSGSFFRHYWDLIHCDLCNAVRNFFVSGKLLHNINHTIISLIPKVKNPISMIQLRPISLCQFLYKIIAKILANRLSKIIPSLIGGHKTGFVRERRITDKIIIAHEIMHFLKRKNRGLSHYMALKLEMEKAYDRIEWSFHFETIRRLGFHSSFISWIRACITAVSYSVNFNGRRVGFFKPSRGLRQGD